MVPLERRTSRPSFPSDGEKRNSRRTRLLPGPREMEELSRRMTPSDPSGPVLRVSPAWILVPVAAGRTSAPRVTVADPAEVRTTPMVPSAAAWPKVVKENVTRRIATYRGYLMFFLIVFLQGG